MTTSRHAERDRRPETGLVVATDGTIEDADDPTAMLFGYRPHELIGRPLQTLLPLVDGGLAAGRWAGDGIAAIRKDGSTMPVGLALRTVMTPAGPRLCAMPQPAGGAAVDGSAADGVPSARSASDTDLFRDVFDQAPMGLALIGMRGADARRFVHVNQSLCQITGYSAAELVGHSCHILDHPDEELEAARRFGQVAGGEIERWDGERRSEHADGHEMWLHVSSSVVRDADGAPAYVVSQLHDVSKRRETEQWIEHLALHDPLTDLPNRMLLMDHLTAALERVTRSRKYVAVLFLDLDHFKEVNDQLGHEAGDELLVEAASRLRGALRGRDVVARLGGDEFVIVCEELSEPAEVEAVVRRVERAIGAPVEIRGRMWNLSASIGAAVNLASRGPDGLLRDADSAMYRAKACGPGCSEIADGTLQAGAAHRRRLLDGLRTAVQDGELRVEYQPCIELGTNRMIAVEALLRWEHPEAGRLLPADFLHFADREGYAEAIGDWVITEACRQAAAWREQLGGSAPAMWVNVSARQLGRHRVLERIRAASAQTGFPMTMLGLEISEPEVSGATQQARAELHALHRHGVRVAVDHFRIGRNSISYLRELPIDRIKLDRELVAGLGHDRADTAVANSAAALAEGLELELVAEGVETSEQREALREIGCELAQGYLFARPKPAEEVVAALP